LNQWRRPAPEPKGTAMNENLLNEARYTAEREYVDVQKTVAISSVQVGDRRGDRKVANVKTGRLNTELLDADGKRIDYFRNETGVLITRTEETAESRELQERMRRNRSILASVLSRGMVQEKARESFNEYLAEYGTVEPGRLANLLQANAEYKVWEDFARIAERVQEADYNGDFEGDLVDLMARFADQLRDRLLQPFGFRALSRSTGVVHNLVEDVEREAIAKFLDSLRWYL
jgi:hypothetical protein